MDSSPSHAVLLNVREPFNLQYSRLAAIKLALTRTDQLKRLQLFAFKVGTVPWSISKCGF
jgi:hypothetical protein